MFQRLLLTLFTLLSLLSTPSLHASATPHYQLAITATFQNEARFLREWIEFHLLVGVEHFFLYNNASNDDYETVLQPYLDNGIVDLIDWHFTASKLSKWQKLQRQIYNHSLTYFGRYTQWMAFIDVDEFLVPVEVDTLPLLLRHYENYGGLSVNQQLFGTSDVSRIPEGHLLIETLTYQAEPSFWEHSHIKVIAQPSRVKKFYSYNNLPEYKIPYFQVNSDYLMTAGPLSHSPLIDKIRINHYWTGDGDHLNTIKMPRWQRWFPMTEICRKLQRLHAIEDHTINRFIQPLRLQMSLVPDVP